MLGAVRGDAVLPIWTGAFAAGDLRRIGQLRREAEAFGNFRGAEEIDLGVREPAPTVGAVPNGVGELSDDGVFFVTRMKDNAVYGVVEERKVPEKGNVLSDKVIFFYRTAAEGQEHFFRRIEVWDEEKQRTLVFLTNHLTFGATT